MKPRLTLKHMLLATACCVILSTVEILFGSQWTSPREVKILLYWIIVLIGWGIYFLDRFKKR